MFNPDDPLFFEKIKALQLNDKITPKASLMNLKHGSTRDLSKKGTLKAKN